MPTRERFGGVGSKCGANWDSVRGLLTYRHVETGIEIGVKPIEPRSQFALFVEETSEIGTGLAIFKPDASPEIEFQIRDQAGRDPIGEVLRWGDFQQRARTLPEWFEGVDTGFLTDFRGLLFLRAADDSSFAPLGLRFGKRKESLSAVPVIPIRDADAGKVYWTDRGTDKIQRANLDGRGVEDLVIPRLIAPEGLALDLGAGKMYWDGREDPAGQSGRNRGGRPRHLGIVLAHRSGAGPERRQDVLDGSGGGQDPAGQPGRQRGGRPRYLGIAQSRGFGAGPGRRQDVLDGRGDSQDSAGQSGRSGVENLVTEGLIAPEGLTLDLGARKMYWTDSWTGQDPAGQPGRQRGGRPRHPGIWLARGSDAGPGRR